MPMYQWDSEAMGDWNNGDILAVADTVEEARAKVLEAVHHQGFSEYKIEQISREIQCEPFTNEVLFIRGSA